MTVVPHPGLVVEAVDDEVFVRDDRDETRTIRSEVHLPKVGPDAREPQLPLRRRSSSLLTSVYPFFVQVIMYRNDKYFVGQILVNAFAAFQINFVRSLRKLMIVLS